MNELELNTKHSKMKSLIHTSAIAVHKIINLMMEQKTIMVKLSILELHQNKLQKEKIQAKRLITQIITGYIIIR